MKIKFSFKDLKTPFLPQKVSESCYEGLLSTQNIRKQVAQRARQLIKMDFKKIEFKDIPSNKDRRVAEGLLLGSYDYKKIIKKGIQNTAEYTALQDETEKTTEYKLGEVYARAQNYARILMDTPSNLMTPTLFCKTAQELFKNEEAVQVKVRDKDWAKSKNMGAFLSVGRGSEEPLKFLELHYAPASLKNDTKKGPSTLLLVGKGVTFDSGGISIKPSADMAMMKGDMGGAAVVLSSLWAISTLKLDINVTCLIPLTENMPSGLATKPGDVVTAGNGMTIEVSFSLF